MAAKALLPRQAFIDPMSFAGLTVVNAIVHSPETLLERCEDPEELLRYPTVLEKLGTLPAVDYRAVVLSTIVQAGLDRFAVLEAPVNVDAYPESFRKHAAGPLNPGDLPEFVQSRLDLPGSTEWLELGHQIEAAIVQSVPDYRVLASSGTMTCHKLITDFVYGLRNGQHIIIDSSIEDVGRLSSDLPDEIGVPFRNLLAAMNPVSPEVCVPRRDVPKDQLVRFKELLASPQFTEYRDEHGNVSSSQRSLSASVRALSESAHRLWETNPDLVRVKSAAVSLLPAGVDTASKLVEGLPGGLLSFVSSSLRRFLDSKRRLLVYELGDVLDEIMASRLRKAVDAGWPSEK